MRALGARAATTPDAVALAVDGGPQLTYREWDTRSAALAAGLAERGVGPGVRVVLLFDIRHWVELAVAAAGVAKAGGVAVPVSPQMVEMDLWRLLRRCRPHGVVAPPELCPADAVTTPAWVATVKELEDGHVHDGMHPDGPDADPEVLLFRVAPLREATILAAGPGPDEGVSGSAPGPLLHTFPVGTPEGHWALWSPLWRGAPSVAVAGIDADRLVDLIAEWLPTNLGLTPVAARILLAAFRRPLGDSSLSEVVLAPASRDERLPARLAAALPGAKVTPWPGAPAPPGTEGGGTPAVRVVPAAASQEAFLWHEQFTPGYFNVRPIARRLRGPLDTDAMSKALAEVVRRHAALRTTFRLDGGEPVQVVGATTPEPAVVDLADRTADDREAEAGRLLAGAATAPFDLVSEPPFQATLVRLGPLDHVLMAHIHHLVWDDWSLALFRRELSAIYAAALAGRPSPLPEPSVQFADVSIDESRALAGGEREAQLSWWRKELNGAPMVTQLDIHDPVRPAIATTQEAEPLAVDLPASLVADLRALARDQRATVFMTMLAAVGVLAHHHTGRDDVLIASVVANRSRTEHESLIASFAKKVPVRLRLHGDPTFSEVVTRTRQAVIGALTHPHLSFETVLQEVLGGQAARHGLVPVAALVFQTLVPELGSFNLPGLTTSRFEPPPQDAVDAHAELAEQRARLRLEGHIPGAHRSHFMGGGGTGGETERWGSGLYLDSFLRLFLVENGGELGLVARGVFHPPAVERLLADFQQVLAAVASEPHRPISDLAPLVTRPIPPVSGAAEVDLGGFRVDLSRIESVLADHPAVADVGVVCETPESGAELELVAYVVPRGPTVPTLSELRAHLWSYLPGYAWPAVLVPVRSLPRHPDGRLVTADLPPAGSRPLDAPTPTSEEVLLTAAASEALGADIAPSWNYWQQFPFLDALAMVAEAGVSLDRRYVQRTRTVGALAAALRAERLRADRERER